jgi:hypothetical protein
VTTISDIYDAVPVAIEAAISGYTRLPNPYEPERAPESMLAKAYGFTMGPGENPERDLSCQLQTRRLMAVTLTRAFALGEFDTTARATVEKELWEDHFSLVRTFERGVLSDVCPKCAYISDSGIVYLDVGEGGGRYLTISSVFELVYFENLT